MTASIVPADGKFQEAALDLLRSLAPHSELLEARTGFEKEFVGIVPAEIDTWDKAISLVEESSIFESSTRWEFTTRYETSNGQTMDFVVALVGADFYGGVQTGYRGLLMVQLDERLKTTGFWWRDLENKRGPYGLRADWDGWREFLLLMSFQTDHGYSTSVEHMGVMVESNWSAPELTAVMYHADMGEFVRDFKRIRAGYHTPGLFYGAYSGTWEPSPSPWDLGEHQRRHLDYCDLVGMYDPTGQQDRLSQFVQSLEAEDVERAWELSGQVDPDSIDLVLSCADPEIKFERLGSGGLLYAEPSTALYPAYIDLWNFLKENHL